MINLVDFSSQQKLEIVKKLHPGFLPVLLFSILLNLNSTALKAEGTKQVSPTANDFVMLEVNNPAFGDFASFGGPAESRLFVSIENTSEIVYFGLSPEYSENGTNVFQSQGKASYRMRIFRYNGPGDSTLVHGPFIIGGLSNPVNVTSRAQAAAGPDVLDPVNGYSTANPVYAFQPTAPGDYFVEFQDVNTTDNGQRLLIPFWDITVVQNGQEKIGRVWSKNWAFRTPPITANDLFECQWDRPFTGTLFSYTTDGFVSKIDYSESGFQGLSFNVAFNRRGPNNTGDASIDRQSVPGQNLTGNAAEHKIFLNAPDIMLFPSETASCGSIVAAALFSCQGNGEFCLEVEVNKPGQINIILDFDQDGVFTPGSRDVNLVYTFEEDELSACVPWDGIRGDGVQASFGDTVNIVFIFSQGVQNWAVYDAEFLKNGFCVEVVRPICADGIQPNFLYWDDREIPLPSGTGQPNDGRSGCECTSANDNCRTWNNFNLNTDACESVVDSLTTGYGDKNTLNTWWFANIIKLDTINVPLLTCQINGDSTLCEGDAAEFVAEVSSMTTMFNYSWEGPNGFTGFNASTGPITTPGEYCVTITDERNCSTTCCKTLTQFDRPTLSVSGTEATCEGGATDGMITAEAMGGAGNFMYQLDNGPFQSSGIFPGLTPGIYTVRVMDEVGCIAEASQQIDLELFGLLNYPDSLFICYSDSIQIGSPGDINNLTFEWSPTTGLDDPNSATPIFFPDTTTNYTVTVSLDGVDICQFVQEVLVFVSPNLNLQVQNTDICVSPFVLTASSDVADATFTWLDANENIISTSATLEVILSGTATYTVIATDSFGCKVEEEITVSGGSVDVDPLADQIVACLGEEVDLSIINQDPSDNLTYSWTPENVFAPGTANTSNPDYIETVGEQTVFVSIENQFGCTMQDTIDITVLDADLELSFAPTIQCDGLTVIFTNTSQNIADFVWDFGDNTTSTETDPTHTYAAAGTYTVTLTTPYDASCSDTVTTIVEVADTVVIAAFDYNLDCTSMGAQVAFFDASIVNAGTVVNWNWIFSNGTTSNEQNPVVTIAESGEITAILTVELDNGCNATVSETLDIQLIETNIQDTLVLCPNTSVFLNPDGNPSYSYLWSPATGLSATDIANPEATPGVTTTYTVEISNIGSDTCVVTEEVTVIVAEDFVFDIGNDQTTCGEDVTLNANVGASVTVEWFSSESGPLGSSDQITVNPFRTDTISAIATNQFGCTKNDTVIITDNGVDISVTPDFDINTCEPIITTISITNLDEQDQLTYAWSPAENIISATDEATISVFVNEGSVTFIGVISNQLGCDSTVSVTISIAPFEIIIPDTVYVCAGQSVNLSPDANPSYEYEWFPADNLDDPTSNNPLFTGMEDANYSVTVSDQSSGILCDTTINVTVIVLDSFNLDVAPGDTSLCSLEPITLNATTTRTDDFEINWYLNNDFSSSIGTGFMLTITPLEGENIFTIIASDNFGCADTSTVTIQATDFQPGLESPVQICANTPTAINPNGNPAYQYTWEPIDGLDLSNPSNPVATIDMDRTYNVTVTDPISGCETITQVDVFVHPLLNLQTSDDLTICESEVVTLTATTDLADAIISWSLFPDFSVVIIQGGSFTFSPVVGETVVYILAEDGNGCVESDSITINVIDLPLDPLPNMLNVCIDVPTPLNPSGDNSFTYNWAPSIGLSATDVPNPIVTISESMIYTVTITDATGLCEVLDTISVEVYPDINLETTGDTTICELEELTLTATTDVAASIEWFKEGNNIGSGNSLLFTPMEGTNTVTAIATDVNGCIDSSTVTIIYLPFDGGIPDSVLMVCFEEPTPLNPNGDPGLLYSWAPPTGLSATDVANPIATVNENITYTVTIADPDGVCVLVDTLVVEVYPDINLQTMGDTLICELTDQIILTATTDVPATIGWFQNNQSLGTGNSLPYNPAEGTNTVTAVATDANGCTDSSTVIIIYLPIDGGIPDSVLMVCFEEPTPLNPNGDPGLLYSWAPPTGLSATDVANPIATVNENITYTVTIADPTGICTIVDTLIVEVYPDINLQTTGDTTICELEELTLTATTDVAATIEWFKEGNNIGSGNTLLFTPMEGTNTVTAIATDANGCIDSSTVTIIYLPFDGGIPDSVLMVCFEEPTPLNPNGDPGLVYTWAPPNGLSATDVANPIATVNENITYTVTIADPDGVCVLVDTLIVEVYPDINLQTMGDTLICELTDQIILTATTDVPATIGWFQNNQSLGTGISLPYNPTEGTNTVTAVATDDNGCTDSSTVIIIYLPIDGGIPDSVLMVCFEEPTPLNPNGDPELLYTWAPPTGLSATDVANPIATVSENITYTVTIADPSGTCVIVDTLIVEVYPDINLQTTGDTTICELEELSLSATTDVAATIEWFKEGNNIGSGNTLLFTPMEGTNTVTAIATDVNGCIDSSTVTIIYLPFDGGIPDSVLMVCFEEPTPLNPNGDPGLIYSWAPPTGLSATNVANPIATLSENITYTVTIADPGGVCVLVDTLIVEVYPDINLQTTGDTTICELEELTLTATTDVSATIEWFKEGNNIGTGNTLLFTPMEGTNTVTAIATDTNGCTDSSIVIIIYLPIDGGIPDSVLMVCFEEPTPLNPNGDQGLLYSWAPPTGLSATDIANPIATVSENITYTVTIADPDGVCVLVDTLIVEVYPDINLQTTGDTTICELEELTLTATTDVPATIEWFTDGNNIGTGNTLPFTPMEGSNTVTAIATDTNGCTDSSQVTIIYLPMDGVGIPDSLLIVCPGEPTPLNPDGDPGLTYKWSPEFGLDDPGSYNPIATIEENIIYTVTISDSASICFIIDTLVVEIAPPINLETMGDTTICEMTTLNLMASTDVPTTIEWFDESGSVGNGNSIEYTPGTAGINQVLVIATDDNGCMDSSTINIIYLPEDGVLDSPIRICANTPTPLNPEGDPIFNYEWSPADNLDDPNAANPIATLSMSTTFTVTITTPDQVCEVIDTLVVEVLPDIGLTTTGDTTICEINEVLLTATTENSATIEWFDDSGSLGTNDSLLYTPEMEGSNPVLAVATDENGCMDSSTVIILYLPPDGGLADSTLLVCPDSPTPLNPNADPGLIYNWEPGTGLSDPTTGNPIVTITENITYTVTISTPNMECTVFDTLEVEVYPSMELEISADTTLCSLQEVILTATTQLPASIEWFDEAGNNLGTGNTISFTPTIEGINSVMALAIDENGCRDSNRVNINYLPLDSGVMDSLSTCSGIPIILNSNGNPDLNYQWGPVTGLDDPSSPKPIATIFNTMTYTVTVTDPNSGCQNVDTLLVEVYPEIGLETSEDTTVCDSNAIELFATTDIPTNIQWFDPADNSELGLGNSIMYTPDPGINVVGVLVKDENGCNDTSFVTITLEILDTGLEPNVSVCDGAPTPLNPNGNPNLVYQWSPETGLDLSDPSNPIATLESAQTYSVTVTDAITGCEVIAEVAVQIAASPNIATSPDTTICAAELVSLSVSSDSTDVSYVWYDHPDLIDEIGDGEMISVTPFGSTTYYVVGTNAAGCNSLDSVEVAVIAVNASITPDPMLCEPVNSFELMVTNLDTNQVLSFEWFPDSAIISEPATGPMVTVNPNLTNAFTAVVTNQFGCTDTLNTTITIIDLEAQLEIDANPDTIIVGESADVFVTGCDECDFTWDGPPDTFEPGNGPTITVNPSDPGVYVYEAIVTDGNNCVAILSQEIVVRAEPLEICDPNNYFLPNTFTPNDDGMNDEFLLRSRLAELIQMELIIYDRWGEEVFRTQDINNGWKGTYKGERLSPDVYGYYLKVICPGDEKIELKGNVSLIR